MDSRAKVAGHPLHQMLIVFPLGLLATAAVFDVIYLAGGGSVWATVAFYLIAAGIIGGLVAAVPGVIDWTAIPRDTRAKYIGALHGAGNVVVIALFGASWLLREPTPAAPPWTAYLFSFLGAGIAIVTGWLGGELVDRLGVGVDDGAHLNAPSSLSGLPASTGRTISVPGYSGADRRHHAEPAYAGAERRSRAGVRG